MTWPAAVVVGFNVAQVVALAWIASRQQQVRQELERVNGSVDARLVQMLERLDELPKKRQPQ